jgi:pseudaminic acid cytidylyltransferase
VCNRARYAARMGPDRVIAKKMRCVALIPARGGSKRLPRKNILPFRGRPMIAWTIEAATRSDLFERIVVSTDDDEIAGLAEEAGAEVLLRPSALGADNVPLLRVAEHALTTFGDACEAFCLLMPNCPLRQAFDVCASFALFSGRGDGASVMSVFGYGWSPPSWALRQHGSYLTRIDPDESRTGTRDGLWCPSGAIRWQRSAVFLGEPDWYPQKLVGFDMPWHRALDIDTREDYDAARCIAHAVDHGFRFSEEAAA